MAKLPPPVDPKLRKELEATPEGKRELRALDKRRKVLLDKHFPKPSPSDVLAIYTHLQTRFDSLHNGVGTEVIGASSTTGQGASGGNDQIAGIRGVRDMRYHRDELAPKWQKDLQGTTRIRSNLTNSEIKNARGVLGRNDIKVTIKPAGSAAGKLQKAAKETRACNALPYALEKQAGWPLIQMGDDALAEASLMAHEIFLTDAYEDISFDRQTVTDVGDDGEEVEREETDDEYDDRIDGHLISCGLPFGMRVLDPLTVVFDWDKYGVCRAIVTELKPYHIVYDDARDKMTPQEWKAAELPQPYDEGASMMYPDAASSGYVLTRRMYDRRWMYYEVAGKQIECEEHGLPGVPVIPGMGWVTNSPSYGEKFQGVTWGMGPLERALNDRLTLDFDSDITYAKPLPFVETDVGGSVIYDIATGKSAVLDLRKGVLQLNPGQHLKDATAGFKIQRTEGIDIIMGLFTRSGMNPVAQGESPGTDASGYAINSLQGASLEPYRPILMGKKRLWENTIDFFRLLIRDVIREKVWLTAPMDDGKTGGVEWMSISPDEITEIPCQVEIDPLSEQNRAAIAAVLSKGVAEGAVPLAELQRRGYGADSVEEWNRQIDLDAIRRVLRERGVQETLAVLDDEKIAQQRMAMLQASAARLQGAPVPSGLVGPDGVTPLTATAPEPTAPTVGPQANAASQQMNGRSPGTMPTQQIAGQRPPSQGLSAREMAPA